MKALETLSSLKFPFQFLNAIDPAHVGLLYKLFVVDVFKMRLKMRKPAVHLLHFHN